MVIEKASPDQHRLLQQFAFKRGHVIRDEVDNKFLTTARVNHGRWVADCPFCNGAEMVNPNDPYFDCGSCSNKTVNGKRIPVVFPKLIYSIEVELLPRPKPNQNWEPGETIFDLMAENIAMVVE